MDLVLLLALFSVIILLVLSSIFLFSRPGPSNKPAVQENVAEVDRPRRAQVVRNQRNRLRAQGRNEEIEEQQESDTDTLQAGDEKMGAKKRAKMEAKAEKKAQRELEEKRREDNKKREQQEEVERLKITEKMKQEEQKLEEEKKKLQEEKERREHEEYLKMKEAFMIEEEGYEEDDDESDQSLQKFISYIKDNKVIVIEDLAVMFKLKTQACIDRIQDLQNDNILSGVMDDRGKYIYISQEELESFAKFIKQRGRVSLSELAEGSNKLINLQPKHIVTA